MESLILSCAQAISQVTCHQKCCSSCAKTGRCAANKARRVQTNSRGEPPQGTRVWPPVPPRSRTLWAGYIKELFSGARFEESWEQESAVICCAETVNVQLQLRAAGACSEYECEPGKKKLQACGAGSLPRGTVLDPLLCFSSPCPKQEIIRKPCQLNVVRLPEGSKEECHHHNNSESFPRASVSLQQVTVTKSCCP